jgi:hypothetical protein
MEIRVLYIVKATPQGGVNGASSFATPKGNAQCFTVLVIFLSIKAGIRGIRTSLQIMIFFLVYKAKIRGQLF